MAQLLSRRSFLAGTVSATVLAACSSGGQSNSSVEPGPDIDGDTVWLQAGFADGLRLPTTLMAGRAERAPFVFFGANGLPAVNGVPGTVDMLLTAPDGSAQTITATRRDVDIPTPHYPLLFTPEVAGRYTVEVEVDTDTQLIEFLVGEPGSVGLVAPGDPMRPIDTPTFDNARGYEPICTRFDPCPFHQVNLTDALDSGRPTAMMISTPGFCRTAICGPVLELLIDIDPAEMNVIHAEIYTEPDRLAEVADFTTLVGPIVREYEMDFEPSFIVADGNGVVTARLDYAFDRDEMQEALATAN